MDLSFSPQAEAFRAEARAFLEEALGGPFAAVRGRGGLGEMDVLVEERRAFEQHLAAHGWSCIAWPEAYGGRGATLEQEILFELAYAEARGPGRVGHVGEGLLGPTVIRFGTEAQKQRFLPPIAGVTELWCQGYSEPNAGSDLANLQTRAVRGGEGWRLTGQKVWTSLAEHADQCFVLARTSQGERKHQGISCLLVEMRQPGVSVVPIRQATGSSEFCEVFFDEAVSTELLGPEGEGWKVAMFTLAVERGASTLAQNLSFEAEFQDVLALARRTGAVTEPVIRDHIADLGMRLRTMRHVALRAITATEAGGTGPETWITKLYWAQLHRDLGELASEVLGTRTDLLEEEGFDPHRLLVWTRSDTIYAGTNQIQRNLIAQRGLGLPR
ncbi:MAG: acyl-CoA dehydrogenase family protein [Alphaproteobacteria bacterium]|nr:acyl-CoA dehydrogenase family protein [Alphaproteobacteria bacterium]